jgi:hypothetical protein
VIAHLHCIALRSLAPLARAGVVQCGASVAAKVAAALRERLRTDGGEGWGADGVAGVTAVRARQTRSAGAARQRRQMVTTI